MQAISPKLCVCAAALLVVLTTMATGQEMPGPSPSGPPATVLEALPLDAAKRTVLRQTIGKCDYASAENLLAEEAGKSPKSQALLLVLAQVLFLDGKQVDCASALRKAELLGPLDEPNRFLLALSYIAISLKNLAIRELEKLEQSYPSNAVYPYWRSRLAYRSMDLQLALTYAEKAVRLDPAFMKAYDQLGLCYAGLNQNENAIGAYTEAVRLNRQQSSHWPWPSLNLGTLLFRLERLQEAESQLRDSVSIDPHFATAHLRLGQVFERKEQLDGAVAELKEAARLDPTYPEPHFALARIYRKRHDAAAAERELHLFQELRDTDKIKGIMRPD
jgi:tetratricopeptide (TPR) repeat protein